MILVLFGAKFTESLDIILFALYFFKPVKL